MDSTVTYTYGPGGERLRKDTGSGSTEYIYFAGGIIAELNPTTSAWTDYIFASGKRIAKDTSNNGTGAQYYQGDHLGSARLMTDASGTVISNCTYAPYGEQVGCSPDNTSNHYRFTGKERDSESGIDYFGARYYSSSLGRFMTPDWSPGPATVPYAHLGNPQTLNLYGYVDNNPINGIDADGHSPKEYMVAGASWDLTGIMSSGEGETTAFSPLEDPQPQNLTLDQVAGMIQQAQKSKSDPITTAINIFNSLGNNIKVTGDILRAALQKAGIDIKGSFGDVVADAQTITKSKNTVTITLSKERSFRGADGKGADFSKKISFDVNVTKESASFTHIKGIDMRKGAWSAAPSNVRVYQAKDGPHVETNALLGAWGLNGFPYRDDRPVSSMFH